MMYLILLSGTSFFGLLLLVLGVCGKRVDDHPLCRKCKYDLVGTAELPSNCPECGSKLNKPSSTRIGNRKRKRAVLAIGLVMITASLTTGGLLGWANLKNFDWYPYKPLWVLSNEAMTFTPPRQANKAQQEILRRLTDNELSDKQLDGLIEKSLTIQSDYTIKWDHFWGDLIEAAYVQQKLTDDQLERYLKTAAFTGMILVSRSKVHQGGYMPVQRGFGHGTRAGKSGNFRLYRNYGPLRIDETEIGSSSGRGASTLGKGAGWGGGSRKFDVPIGKHELSMEFHFRIVPTKLIRRPEFTNAEKEEQELMIENLKILDWVDTARLPVEVVDPDEPVIELIDDPTLKESIRKATNVNRVQLRNARGLESYCWIEFDALPIPVGFEVFWRVGEQEWSVLQLTALKAKDSLKSHFPHRSIEGFPIDTTHVDIILRSSAKVAEYRAGLNTIWQGEIVIPNQPLEVINPDD